MLLSSLVQDVGVYPCLFPCCGEVVPSVPLQLMPRCLSPLLLYFGATTAVVRWCGDVVVRWCWIVIIELCSILNSSSKV